VLNEMAEKFNHYFTLLLYLQSRTLLLTAAESLFQGGESNKLLDIYIDESLVMKKLDCLRIDESPGADNMSPRVLVELKDVIVFPVTLIMKCSLASGIVPEDWKTANVSPIHKSGAKSHASNYRPISLTSHICKLFESIIRDAVIKHLEINGLVNGSQYGFRKSGSCLSNLLQFLDQVNIKKHRRR